MTCTHTISESKSDRVVNEHGGLNADLKRSIADLRDVENDVEEANQAEGQDYVFNAVEFAAEYVHLRNCLLDFDSSDLSLREGFRSGGY